jgi:hypothetical protein
MSWEGTAVVKRLMARTLWIAAWGAWCWAGYGLWRELPRTLGRKIGKLDFAPDEVILGTLRDQRTLVSSHEVPPSYRITCWDVTNGMALRVFNTPAAELQLTGDWIAVCSEDSLDKVHEGPSLFLHLPSGAVYKMPRRIRGDRYLSMHSHRPWVAAEEVSTRLRDGLRGSRLVIRDVTSGKLEYTILDTGNKEHPSGFTYFRFLPESDSVFVVAKNDLDGKPEAQVWSVPPGTEPISRFPWKSSDDRDNYEVFSQNNRVAWADLLPGRETTSVVDLRTGRLLLFDAPAPPVVDPDDLNGFKLFSYIGPFYRPDLALSPDGQMLFDARREFVVSIEDGSVIWSGRHPEGDNVRRPAGSKRENAKATMEDVRSVQVKNHLHPTVDFKGAGRIEADEGSSSLLTARLWNEYIGDRVPHWRIDENLRTVRNLRTGQLLYRCDGPTLDGKCIGGWVVESAGILVKDDGSLLAASPKVRWGLIALLQAILASPIVALWGLLRWRRWRLARAAA